MPATIPAIRLRAPEMDPCAIYMAVIDNIFKNNNDSQSGM